MLSKPYECQAQQRNAKLKSEWKLEMEYNGVEYKARKNIMIGINTNDLWLIIMRSWKEENEVSCKWTYWS